MVSNFETPREKLMQIVLAGQPQLAEKLASPNLVQLRQRISIIARLKPFAPEETNLYVGHRLRVAGYEFRAPLFTRRAEAMIGEHSEGIPRNINNICFNAMSLGCALNRTTIDEDIIREVIEDLDLGSGNEPVITSRMPTRPALEVSTGAANGGMKSSGRVWVSRVAAAATLLLALTWSLGTGEGTRKALASQISPAALTNAVRAPSLISSVPVRTSGAPSAGQSDEGFSVPVSPGARK
jgi:general secretion pathway protein A